MAILFHLACALVTLRGLWMIATGTPIRRDAGSRAWSMTLPSGLALVGVGIAAWLLRSWWILLGGLGFALVIAILSLAVTRVLERERRGGAREGGREARRDPPRDRR